MHAKGRVWCRETIVKALVLGGPHLNHTSDQLYRSAEDTKLSRFQHLCMKQENKSVFSTGLLLLDLLEMTVKLTNIESDVQ